MLSTDEATFRERVEPHRRELQVHCYRILGSVQDAEDIVQETLVSAWRGFDGFKGDASLRTWLYTIATNRCLNALRARSRRPREVPPPPGDPGFVEPTRRIESVWVEPYPDALLEGVIDRSADPEARYDAREAVELAFVVALQQLPPRQRAVLVLRDVLAFQASEVAATLETTEAAVNSALHRARAALDEVRGAREHAPLPQSAAERDLVGRFADAFGRGDVQALVALLTDDAVLTMPPEPFEFRGREDICRFFSSVPAGGALERFHLVPTRANGQPAFACYLRDPHGPRAHAYGLMVLTLDEAAIARITGFPDTSVFPSFGLPRTLTDT
jgi:RNA polymerase sigma-70 factor (TIGR02960 family)